MRTPTSPCGTTKNCAQRPTKAAYLSRSSLRGPERGAARTAARMAGAREVQGSDPLEPVPQRGELCPQGRGNATIERAEELLREVGLAKPQVRVDGEQL